MGTKMTVEQEQRIAKVVEQERSRLRKFIQKRVPNRADAEDIFRKSSMSWWRRTG